MKSNPMMILGLAVFAGLLAAAPVRAEDAPANCEVPAYLLTSESSRRLMALPPLSAWREWLV